MAERFRFSLRKMLTAATLLALWCGTLSWMHRSYAVEYLIVSVVVAPPFVLGFIRKDGTTGCRYSLAAILAVVAAYALVAIFERLVT